MGVCLLSVQLAERALAGAVESVLKDRTMTADELMEQTERERKRTLGHFIKELGRHTQLEPHFDQNLWDFLKMRNTFVHDLSEVSGWNLRTEEGKEVAIRFLAELLLASSSVAGVFMSVFTVSAREEFGVDLIKGHPLMTQLEKELGPFARKILAGRNRKITAGRNQKLVLVHSKEIPGK
jgi:hypothetical protein